MNKVSVIVANRPCLMRDIVLVTLADQPDIEVVGEAQNDDEIRELVER
jgi:chemotaxis response regulator CheB